MPEAIQSSHITACWIWWDCLAEVSLTLLPPAKPLHFSYESECDLNNIRITII